MTLATKVQSIKAVSARAPPEQELFIVSRSTGLVHWGLSTLPRPNGAPEPKIEVNVTEIGRGPPRRQSAACPQFKRIAWLLDRTDCSTTIKQPVS